MQWRSYRQFDWRGSDMRQSEANAYALSLVSHSRFSNCLTYRRDDRVLFLDDDNIVNVAKSVRSAARSPRHDMYRFVVSQELDKRKHVDDEGRGAVYVHVTVERSRRLMNQQSSARPARLTSFCIHLSWGKGDGATRLEYSSKVADHRVLSNCAMRL